jgi:hypothetical protein
VLAHPKDFSKFPPISLLGDRPRPDLGSLENILHWLLVFPFLFFLNEDMFFSYLPHDAEKEKDTKTPPTTCSDKGA